MAKEWTGHLSPKLEERYHDMLRDMAKRSGKTQTDKLKEIIEKEYTNSIPEKTDTGIELNIEGSIERAVKQNQTGIKLFKK